MKTIVIPDNYINDDVLYKKIKRYIKDVVSTYGSMFVLPISKDSKDLVVAYDIPSKKSFFIFGGLYDPETAYLYLGGYKGSINIPILDMSLLFGTFSGVYTSANYTTRILQQYKLTGNLDSLKSGILNSESRNSSIIERHISGISETVNKLPIDNLESILKGIYNKIVLYSSCINYLYRLLLCVINGNLDLEKRLDIELVKRIGVMEPANLFETTIRSIIYNPNSKVLNSVMGMGRKYGGKKQYYSLAKEKALNLMDILEDNDFVYSSDVEGLLKKYQIEEIIDKKDIKILSKGLSEINFNEFEYYRDNQDFEKLDSDDLKRNIVPEYDHLLLSSITNIRYINKSILRSVK